VPDKDKLKRNITMNFIAKSVRLGWLPFYPTFDKNPSLGKEKIL